MANAFAVCGGVCTCLCFLMVTIACGIPFFSGQKHDVVYPVEGKGTQWTGSGIWGTGLIRDYDDGNLDKVWDYKTWISIEEDFPACNVEGLDIDDLVYCHPSWIKGAEAASIITILVLIPAFFVGVCSKANIAGVLTFIAAILTTIPFALWEAKYCGTSFNDAVTAIGNIDNPSNDCHRSWSYGVQVTAFVFLLITTVLFCCAHSKRDDV